MKAGHELPLFRFREALSTQLKQTRDVTKALRHSLRATREFFQASHAAVAVARPGEAEAELLLTLPDGAGWDLTLLAAFIGNRYPTIPQDMLVAPLRRGGRTWAAIALRRRTPFDRGAIRPLLEIASAVSESIERIDLERMLEVRDRIDRKMMERLRSNDLFYQILDGLRSLTRYDHSSALLIQDGGSGGGALSLAAEQIAWVKGKSRRIGLCLPLEPEVRDLLGGGEVFGFEREGDLWREWRGRPVTAVAGLLDYNRVDEPNHPDARERSMLCAPLVTGDGLLGVLKIASRRTGTFGPYDAGLVERFRSHVAVAIRNSQRAETLHTRMIEAERKHAMADLARSVAHDVNNALGAVLPLVQQLHEEARGGAVDCAELGGDLEQIQRSLEVCRRIFGGMLSFARDGARAGGRAQVAQAVESTLGVLRDGLDRMGITVAVALEEPLPPVAGSLSELEQVLLNLLTNAREAMPAGGRIDLRARPVAGGLEIAIADTGIGIPPELLARVQEPFFTTKERGSGLGLAICRSVVWSMGGKLYIESAPGQGTSVRIFLPEPA
ncbi:MAG TPA: ATP-binding protein [Candidatus Polarisedimenticolaceae bacterium]|nr:ATP-binding protein [Candidatus Polarisedimenticolaceae bacterium]